MRILQIGKFYPIRGGVEKVMWDLTRGLVSRGVECDMLCAMLRKDDFDDADRADACVDGRCRIISFGASGCCICVPAIAKVAATMISPAMVCWLRRHCGEYDIIHIHHPDPMACLALRLSGFKGKIVLHWHSDILKQKGLLRAYLPLQKWLVRRADRIVGTTPVYVKSSPALSEVQDKVTYLPIGIEDNIRNESAPNLSGEFRTVFSLGRLVEYKGFTYLVEAARYLPDGYRIVIGGKGPLEGALKRQIESCGLDGKVELKGYLSDPEIREWYNRCDVFVLSSIMKSEAFGIVQLEAMSCGKPVVATEIPGSGTSWVNAHGISGINVPVCDSVALADAIKEICGSGPRYNLFCRNARTRYEKMFALDTMVDGALEIYNSIG